MPGGDPLALIAYPQVIKMILDFLRGLMLHIMGLYVKHINKAGKKFFALAKCTFKQRTKTGRCENPCFFYL